MDSELHFLPCVIPPEMHVDKCCYVPPDVHYFNSIYACFNMHNLLKEIDEMPNPDEESISAKLREALLQPFLKFLSMPDDSSIALDMQLLLRHRLVQELRWFSHNSELTPIMSAKAAAYLDNCCYCFDKKFQRAKTLFGDTFDELWTMATQIKSDAPINTPIEKAIWIYNKMKDSFKCSELGGNIQAQVNFHMNQIIVFVINVIKSGKQAHALYTICCNHTSH